MISNGIFSQLTLESDGRTEEGYLPYTCSEQMEV